MDRDTARQSETAASFVCPVCKHPVETVVVKRRKVLGAVVPVWGPGPCRRPECPLNARKREGATAQPGSEGTAQSGPEETAAPEAD